MNTINRTAILVSPKKPYIDWANSFDDSGPKFDEDETQMTAYLISDSYDELNYRDWIKKNYKDIFEEELNSWITAPGAWPQKMTFKMFMEWFEVRVAGMIYDLGTKPLHVEEY